MKTPPPAGAELVAALAELRRLNALRHGEGPAFWGRFAVIARHWQALEPLAALCRSQGIPARLLRDDELPALHATREGAALLALLSKSSAKNVRPFGSAQGKPVGRAKPDAGKNYAHGIRKTPRLLLRQGALTRWFRRRYGQAIDETISHPYRAMLAQFIADCEIYADEVPVIVPDQTEDFATVGIEPSPAGRGQGEGVQIKPSAYSLALTPTPLPQGEGLLQQPRQGSRPGVNEPRRLVAADLIEALYEFGSGRQSGFADGPHAPLLLLTAHRAKGLEFDHVLILDAGGWQQSSDEELRLFYVAMTRARKTLTLCKRQVGRHAFAADCAPLCLTTPVTPSTEDLPETRQRRWLAGPEHVVLSWPGYFAPNHPIHRAIAALDYGDPLSLHPRSDGKPGWELADANGIVVTRMSQAFVPPLGTIVAVRVAGILARQAKPGEQEGLRYERWEVVLAEIEYLVE